MTDDEINQLVESYGLAGDAGTIAFQIACEVRRRLTTPLDAPKRTAVRLWAPSRMIHEGDDWPVRVSRGDDHVKDLATWVEIKHYGNGFYVEDGT